MKNLSFLVVLTAVLMMGCYSDNENKKRERPTPQSTVASTPTPTPTPRPATAQEINDAKSRAVREWNTKYHNLIHPDWVAKMKNKQADVCWRQNRHYNMSGLVTDMSQGFDVYVTGQPSVSEHHDLKWSDVEVAESEYEKQNKTIHIEYLQSLLTAFKTNDPPKCEEGEGHIGLKNKFELLVEIVREFENSKNYQTGEYRLMPSDIGLTPDLIKQMMLTVIQTEAQKPNPDPDIMRAGKDEWNFTEAQIKGGAKPKPEVKEKPTNKQTPRTKRAT